MRYFNARSKADRKPNRKYSPKKKSKKIKKQNKTVEQTNMFKYRVREVSPTDTKSLWWKGFVKIDFEPGVKK